MWTTDFSDDTGHENDEVLMSNHEGMTSAR
jgi:hypothetical protein